MLEGATMALQRREDDLNGGAAAADDAEVGPRHGVTAFGLRQHRMPGYLFSTSLRSAGFSRQPRATDSSMHTKEARNLVSWITLTRCAAGSGLSSFRWKESITSVMSGLTG